MIGRKVLAGWCAAAWGLVLIAGMSLPPSVAAAPCEVCTDEEFLDQLQQRAFDYFWNEVHPGTGLVRDRTSNDNFCSIAATAFGLTAYGVGVERGYVTREEAAERTLTTLQTLWEQPQGPAASGTIGYQGFFYHFLRCDDAVRFGTSELSSVDTALLLGGVLYARQYFDGDGEDEQEIRALADSIYRRVDWTWAQARPPAISHGWRPGEGFLPYDWVGYNEAMIVYLLALGSPTHPVDPEAWDAWTDGYEWRTNYYGQSYVVFPPLFGHQYTHLWVDFRGIQDAYMRERGIDYFENSRRATLANRAYCISNPMGFPNYGPDEWGLTASDDPVVGYQAHGAPPALNDNGTLTPTALGGSIPFAPELTLEALRHLYDRYWLHLWGPYGFRDAFNASKGWFADDYLGIDQGPFVIMIENHRTEAVWQAFMEHEAVQRGLDRAGFRAVGTPVEPEAELPDALVLEAVHPNPVRARATLRYVLPEAGMVTLTVYDVLGRAVAVPVDAPQAAGAHTVALDAASLPPGVYICTLRSGGTVRTTTMVRVR